MGLLDYLIYKMCCKPLCCPDKIHTPPADYGGPPPGAVPVGFHPQPGLPAPGGSVWQEVRDASGQIYYWNTQTSVTTYERPAELGQAGVYPPQQPLQPQQQVPQQPLQQHSEQQPFAAIPAMGMGAVGTGYGGYGTLPGQQPVPQAQQQAHFPGANMTVQPAPTAILA